MLAICVHKKSGNTKMITNVTSYEEILFNARNIWYHFFDLKEGQQFLPSREWKVRLIDETTRG